MGRILKPRSQKSTGFLLLGGDDGWQWKVIKNQDGVSVNLKG
jgi:hypothetical protein